MADVDITSLSVEISAESQGAELNIDKLAAAISNLRTKGNVTKVVNSLDKLAGSIATLKQASAGMSGLDKITSFINSLVNVDLTQSAKGIACSRHDFTALFAFIIRQKPGMIRGRCTFQTEHLVCGGVDRKPAM